MLATQLYKPLIRSGHTLILLKQYLALLKIQQVATKGRKFCNSYVEGDEQIQPDWIRILGNGREQQKLVVPLPPPPAPSDMQEVGCPCAQIFAVVSLADPMIGILTDYVLQFCCVITKGFPNKGNRRGKYQLANSVWEKTITPNSQLFCSLRNAPYNVIRIPSSSSLSGHVWLDSIQLQCETPGCTQSSLYRIPGFR
ncbi:hypothetical protein Anapl_01477 [Anas platyrhynchos]|uniref:Uncharacterized protein n=1 Tax=Anas platyrhynchos TaxID=8839 RepID=R0M6M7_ANAPL|nr:hypothetical protein Anapl_01477 [Anas platyrhynchos]